MGTVLTGFAVGVGGTAVGAAVGGTAVGAAGAVVGATGAAVGGTGVAAGAHAARAKRTKIVINTKNLFAISPPSDLRQVPDVGMKGL
jgi:hypothetical protein